MDSLKKLEKNDMKYIFFDIDGTLTDNTTGKIVPSAQEALDKLQENGNFVAIATGRAYYKAKNFLKEVGLNNMVCNGGKSPCLPLQQMNLQVSLVYHSSGYSTYL